MNQNRPRVARHRRTAAIAATVALLCGRLAVVAVTTLMVIVGMPAPAHSGRPDTGPADGRDPWSADHADPLPPRAELAWLATENAIFAVDAAERIVRYRGCDGDTGRVLDQGMVVTDGVATGRVTVNGITYVYRVPLRGRAEGAVEIHRPDLEPVVLTGEVVTNPQPPVDRRRGAELLPLTEQLREIVAASPNPTGVAVRDLSGRYGDQQIEVNGTFRPKAASVIKLWILAELLREVDCGWESLSDGVLVRPEDVVGGSGELQHETFPQVVTLYRLARYMIIYSDNTAANVLINHLNGFVRVNALIDTMLLKQTALNRRMLDTAAAARGEENYLTADDVVSLLGAVWDGNILSPASRALMISFMLEQTINTKIPAALPPGVPVAHKTGELPDASHDVGYLLIPHSEVAVAFVTSGPEATGAETVRQLARAVYDYLVPVDAAVTGFGPAPDGGK
ncbi:serine hydrolase [Micromonospora sp. NBC_01796]|uniref:serine hydrolase n=1 Tax=Micromonospora sp. NBC_01796 TaxID=2975987 RepID=UPI002DDC0ADE|nr:serine hydrolase [Micromonospora sp. NBC_01796]WSA86575.1 class A beta-lactamase-related serine hydrolase [Micromonospora sp. NBC_01796]